MGATAWTAVIGRIPVKGTVSDPMPFKVLVGAKNLAANGLELPPELEGMVFSGHAVGDFTLRCSSGKLDSVTFVFNDGTIRTTNSVATPFQFPYPRTTISTTSLHSPTRWSWRR